MPAGASHAQVTSTLEHTGGHWLSGIHLPPGNTLCTQPSMVIRTQGPMHPGTACFTSHGKRRARSPGSNRKYWSLDISTSLPIATSVMCCMPPNTSEDELNTAQGTAIHQLLRVRAGYAPRRAFCVEYTVASCLTGDPIDAQDDLCRARSSAACPGT